jgi:hypothetical protein
MLNIFHGWLQEVGPLGGGPEDHVATTLGLHVGPIPARPPVPALASLAVSRQVHCNENPIYLFLFWELCGLSPNFHIHVPVRIYIFPGLVHIFPAGKYADQLWEIYK